MANGPPSEKLRALLVFQAERAYTYYDEGRELAPLIAAVGRPVLLAIIGTYRGLLDEIVARNYNVLDGRISVSRLRTATIMLRAFAVRFTARDGDQDSERNPYDTVSQTSH
jgi:phytoene synthase